MKILFFMSLCVFANARILECDRFEKIQTYVNEETLILFDIDDTLMVPKQMLGSDEWFGYRCRFHREQGLDQGKALEKALEVNERRLLRIAERGRIPDNLFIPEK